MPAISALSLALTGCATGALPPAGAGIAVPQQWSASDRAGDPAAAQPDLSRYWAMLGDPLLEQFVEQGIAGNFDLAQGAARLDQARAQLALARAGYAPQASGSAGVQRDIGDMARDEFGFSLGGEASWEVDLFGRIGGDVAAARAELEAAGYSLADLQRLVAGQIALSTISARSIAQQLDIARDTLAYQDENLQIARWRVQAGLVSSLDVEQARTQRAQTAATIPALESSLAATGNAISTLIGEPPGRVLALLEDGAAPVPDPARLAGLAPPAEVLRRRPDVRGAEASLLANSARVGVARAQMLPLVRLTGNINTAATNMGDLFDIVTGGLFAGVTQLLFDGGRTSARIDSAEAAAEGSLAAWRLSILSALEEVETAAADRAAAEQRIAIFDEALDAANNAAILARSQYQAGLTDFPTLLTAESQLLSARNAVIGARADRASAFVRLTQALGGGWSPDNLPFPIDGIAE